MQFIWNMMNRKDKGSSFIAVIVCTGLISILGMTMLAMAAMNIQMKLVDRQSKSNFYDAESAVNEITAALQTRSELALKESVQYVETYYAATPSLKINTLLNQKYVSLFLSDLKSHADTEDRQNISYTPGSGLVSKNSLSGKYLVKKEVPAEDAEALSEGGTSEDNGSSGKDFFAYLNSLTTHPERVTITSAGSEGTYLVADMDNMYVEIQNLSVTYTDERNYATTISTDIRFTPPSDYSLIVGGDSSGGGTEMKIDGFSVIADGNIVSKTNNDSVEGGIYAGEDIEVGSGSILKIVAPTVVSRKDLKITDSGSLEIQNGGGSGQAEVWVNNIITSSIDGDTMIDSGKASETSAEIHADCYVSDDLLLNNPNHSVKIDGSYYGYHTGSYKNQKTDDGSSIAINAVNADLDIASGEGQSVWLAGYNTITDFGSDDENNLNINRKTSDIYTGESLTYKWAQESYMVPGGCIVGSGGTNPIPYDTYKTLVDLNDAGEPQQQLKLDFSSYPFINQINITEYLNQSRPYTVKFVRHYRESGYEGNYVYVYMNFASRTAASSYFNHLSAFLAQRTQQIANANILGFGSVNIGATDEKDLLKKMSSFNNAGNMLFFNRGTSEISSETPSEITTEDAVNSDEDPFLSQTDSGSSEVEDMINSSDKYVYEYTEKERNLVDIYEIQYKEDGRSYISYNGQDAFLNQVGGQYQLVGEDGKSITTKSGNDSTVILSPDSNISMGRTDYGTMTIAEGNTYQYEFINREIDLTHQYNGLIGLLDKNRSLGYPSYPLAASVIQQKGLNGKTYLLVPVSGEMTEGTEPEYEQYELILSQEGMSLSVGENQKEKAYKIKQDGEYEKNDDDTLKEYNVSLDKGILISDRTIEVHGRYEGIIMTRKDVELHSASIKPLSYGLDLPTMNGNAGGNKSSSVVVEYRNWRKNGAVS